MPAFFKFLPMGRRPLRPLFPKNLLAFDMNTM